MAKNLYNFNVAGSPVYVGSSALQELESHLRIHYGEKDGIIILTDENTHDHCYSLLIKEVPRLARAHKIIIPSGESHKTLESCEKVWNQLAVAGANRRSLLINLGGGMISDLGGFAGSVFHRGLEFINIPTSLLGMIDASMGGKTGVDLYSLKNIIGVFSNPAAVYVWPQFLNTLPLRQRLSGYAEMMKHALIADYNFWNRLIALPMAVISDWESYIVEAIQIKAEIVNRDPFEKGDRMMLNFGHTLGHAFETWSLRNDDDPLTHGEAIAMGIICETYISYRSAGLSMVERDEVVKQILLNFNHYKIPTSAIDELVEITNYDKKNQKGRTMLTLIRNIGNAVAEQAIEPAIIRESFFRFTDFGKSVEP
ncbi:MAG: 3-dehydroquinate synthase [Lentimicrobium sp.]|jgi:3-dehydroquinate synthase|nr:3-dehydroquinate synthase [Lentimicrobium sp.]